MKTSIYMIAFLAATIQTGSSRADSVVYSALPDLGNPQFLYYGGQSGQEVLDDLHLSILGTLSQIVFQYHEPDAQAPPFEAHVQLYANPNGGDFDFIPIGSPLVESGLAPGRANVTVNVPSEPLVDADVWVGVRFTSPTAGLVVQEIPDVGSSHDIYVENGAYYYFGGQPLANFAFELLISSSPTSVSGPPERLLRDLGASPNPFNPATSIRFELARDANVEIVVFDARGRIVRRLVPETSFPAGRHAVRWDGRSDRGMRMASGVYRYLVRTQDDTLRGGMVLVQ